jgi:gamma-glutamylcyclotransferase (GGCT)/AIG2-like uncharacterized protein YtfP
MADRYFAYGTNMTRPRMARSCPGATFLGRAVLRGHRFALADGGYGSVVRDPPSCVHGVLWTLGPSDEAALDEYEAVARGLYRKERRVVEPGSGGPAVDALIYVAAAGPRGPAPAGHLEEIIAAAKSNDLPESYIAELRSLRQPARAE